MTLLDALGIAGANLRRMKLRAVITRIGGGATRDMSAVILSMSSTHVSTGASVGRSASSISR